MATIFDYSKFITKNSLNKDDFEACKTSKSLSFFNTTEMIDCDMGDYKISHYNPNTIIIHFKDHVDIIDISKDVWPIHPNFNIRKIAVTMNGIVVLLSVMRPTEKIKMSTLGVNLNSIYKTKFKDGKLVSIDCI